MTRTRAILLNTAPYREHDELCSFFTEDFGKLRIVAKGTKKPRSKFSPFLHGFAILDCGFVEGKHLPILTGLDSLESISISALPRIIFEDLCVLFGLCDELMYGGQKDGELWNFFMRVFQQCEHANEIPYPDSLQNQWLEDLVGVLGYGRAAQRNVRERDIRDIALEPRFRKSFIF